VTAGPGDILSTGLAAATALFWLWVAWNARQARRRPPSLADVEAPVGSSLPTLAIVATAKDEGEHIESATRSLLAQEYPNARVIVVDDRSTDATGAILNRLAAEEPRLEVLRIAALPEGWIGKCHALAQGAARADTEWILFTDGDILMERDAVGRAVALALRDGYDHIAVAPDIATETLGERMFVGYFLAMFNASQGVWKASDPRSRAFVGIGAFNLVRREAYRRAGGHEAIRYELLDDMALGKILKRSGARQTLALHGQLIGTRWHAGVRGLILGLEKNAFAAARYSPAFMSAAIAALLVLTCVPYVGWLLPWPAARWLTALAWVGVFLTYAAGEGSGRIRAWQGLLLLPGGLLYNYAMARSMVIALARGSVRWRGTSYPLRDLRRHQVY
jgi:glycosyltransferase involved in cell wall biosynthesis